MLVALVDEPLAARHPAAVLLRSGRVPVLASLLIMVAAAAPLAGCESDSGHSQVLAKEVDKICHAVELSGAAGDETTNRTYLIAKWLNDNVRTEEGIAFLQSFAKLGDDKVARRTMLTEAARANGVRDCPLIDLWK